MKLQVAAMLIGIGSKKVERCRNKEARVDGVVRLCSCWRLRMKMK